MLLNTKPIWLYFTISLWQQLSLFSDPWPWIHDHPMNRLHAVHPWQTACSPPLTGCMQSMATPPVHWPWTASCLSKTTHISCHSGSTRKSHKRGLQIGAFPKPWGGVPVACVTCDVYDIFHLLHKGGGRALGAPYVWTWSCHVHLVVYMVCML